MASKARWQVAWLPEAVRGRTTLLSCTALGTIATLLLATPARSQPAANARPSGGVVSAGSATIGSSASTTTIRQSSQRTAINWQSFDVGSHQTVDFIQPLSSSVALNRVISSNPSQIAGRIDANGQVILLNQSGVIFYQGAQVNTAGLIVSAAGMSNVNFMAGKLVFDQAANPNAAVVNQGSLTVKQAGLAALVAPQVANSGVITAKLGHVVLAGAKTATLDMYGDGMVSLDVNNAVTQAPVGRDGAPVAALVTNTGVIRADGGTVQLTAREADGLVQNLVQAGGTIRADSVGSKTGTVVLGGLGGSIVLSGVVTADGGAAPGSTGGQVQVDASQGVTLAAGSRIRASGPAGGGTVAIGTTLARAKGGPGTASALTAQTVQVDQGARVNASATGNGDGGRITVLSSLSTSMAGAIIAKGGPQGGNGGFVETSGASLSIGASAIVDASALSATGTPGTWLLDPLTLDVVNGAKDSGVSTTTGPPFTVTPTGGGAQISNATIDGELNGGTNVVLTTEGTGTPGTGTGNITVDAAAAITWTTTATLTMNSAGAISILAPVSGTTGTLILNATGGTVSQTTPGTISVSKLSVTSLGAVNLSLANQVTTLAGSVTGHGNSFDFTNAAAALTVGAVAGGATGITTNAGSIGLATTGSGAIAISSPVSSGGAEIDIAAAPGSGVTNTAAISSGGGNIVILGDTMSLSGGTLNAGTIGTVVLGPATTTDAIALGAASGPGVLGLVQADLSSVTAEMLQIGYRNEDATASLDGNVNLSTALTLSTSNIQALALVTGGALGTVTQTAGATLTFPGGTLGVIAGGDVSLALTNSVGIVAALTDGGAGSFAFINGAALSVGALPVQQLGVAVSSTTGLASSAGFAVPVNTAGALAGITVVGGATTGSIVLETTGAGDLTLNQPVNANNGLTTLLTSPGQVGLQAFGNIIQASGGAITGAGLEALAGGSVTLDVTANQIGNSGGATTPGLLAGSAATGSFALSDAKALQVDSFAVSAGATTLATTTGVTTTNSDIDLQSAGLILNQPLAAGAGVVRLVESGAVSQVAAGAITAGSLSVTDSLGQVALEAANGVGTVAVNVMLAGGAFSFNDTALQTVGSVAAAPAASDPSSQFGAVTGATTNNGDINLLSAGLALNQAVGAGTGTVRLVETGAVSQALAGAITAGSLSVTDTAGQVVLDATNVVGTVAANVTFAGGAFTLNNGTTSLIDGSVGVASAGEDPASLFQTVVTGLATSKGDINLASGRLTLNQIVGAGTGTVRLVAGGLVSQASAGVITADSLSVSDSGGQVVLQAANAVNTLATSVTFAGSALTFDDHTTALTVGSVAAASAGEDPSSVFGVVTGATTSNGDINLASGGLALNQAVGAGTGTVRLVESGAVSQTLGAAITAGSLSVTDSTGNVVLEDANAVGTVAASLATDTGSFTFNNGTASLIVGSVGAAPAGADPSGLFGALSGVVTTSGNIALQGAGITLNQAVTAGTANVALTSTGTISQSASGSITAADLDAETELDAGGSITLTGSGNEVTNATLTSLDAAGTGLSTGSIAFVDGSPLTIVNQGGLNFGVLTLGAVQLADTGATMTVHSIAAVSGSSVEIGLSGATALFTNDGAVSATGTGTPPTGDVVILANRMSLSGGTISAPDAVVLGPFATSVAITLDGTATETLSLQQSDLASISAGLLQIGYSSLTGDISIAGALSLTPAAVPALALVTGGSVSETGGGAVAFSGSGSLAVVAGRPVSMQDDNQVSMLAGSTGGPAQGFAFTNANLTLTVGAFPVPLLAVVPDGNNFPVPSTGVTPSGVTTANGDITLATGTAGNLVLDTAVNAGTGAVTLNSVGLIDASLGAITAGVLTDTVTTGGAATFTDAANAVGTLGPFAATGRLSLTDTVTTLNVAGAVSGSGVTLSNSGGITFASGSTLSAGASGTVELDAAGGAINAAQGAIAAGVLTDTVTTGGAATFTDAANAVGSLGPFAATGNIALNDTVALTVGGMVNSTTGNVYLQTSAGGGITFGAFGMDSVSGGTISLQTDALTNLGTPAATGNANAGPGGTFELAPNTPNTAMTLGAASGLSLTSLDGITAGTVRIGAVTLPSGGAPVITAGSITVAGNFGENTINLELDSRSGTISETGIAILTAAMLTGNAQGSVSLANPNVVTTFGPFTTTGQLSLIDEVPTLTIEGAVSGSGVALSNIDGITFAAGSSLSVGTGGTVELDASGGAINASLGAITAGVLTDTVTTGGAAMFTDAANAVTTLGRFAASGQLSLTDTVPTLNLAGSVSGSGVTLNNPGGITFASGSTLSAGTSGIVELDASAGAINASLGAITAGVLTEAVTTGGAATFTDAANAVGTLGPFAATGQLSLADNVTTLNVAGAVSGSGVKLSNSGGITFGTGSTLLAASSGIVELDAAGGAIDASLGAITAGVLTDTVTTGGAATFTNAANVVTTLGPFAAEGELSLTDTVTTLNVAGAVSGSGVTLSNSGGGITFVAASTLSAGASGTVELDASGGPINAVQGAITAGLLTNTVTTGGAATFTDAANAVGTLGPFAATGQVSLTDTVPTLTVAGAVSGSGVTLNNPGGITFAPGSTLSAGVGGTVELDASGGTIDASFGAITAGVLTDTVTTGGAATFTDAANAVGTLGPFAATGQLSLTDSVPTLNVTGAVSGSGVILTNPGGITFASGSTLSAGVAGTVELDASGGAINAALGGITAGVLTDTVTTGGAATFTDAANAVSTLGPFAATGQLSLTDTVPTLNVAGAVSGSGVTLNNPGGITFAAASTLSAGTSGTVELDASDGPINASSGQITAGVLTDTVTTGGAATFTDAANAVTTLGPFAASGQLSLIDTVPVLNVAGAVSGSGVTLNNPGGITFAAGSTLSAGADGTVELDASGGTINASLGAITAGVLTDTVTTGGSATFTDAANTVTTLGPFAAGAELSLTDHVATLNVAGSVSGSGVTLSNTGGMTFAPGSTLSAGGGGTVELDAAGGAINAVQGAITAGLLTDTVTTGGTATFTDAANAVGTLGPFAATMQLSLVDTVPTLTVTGAVSGSGVTLNNPGGITFAVGSTLAAGVAGTVELDASAGSINASLAAITAGVLTDTVTTGGAATFTNAANVVTTLGPFAAEGELSLTDTVATLNVAGAVSGSGVTLNNPGGIAFAPGSTLSAGTTGTVELDAVGGPINAAQGAITAGLLTDAVATGGAATFTDSANAVGSLGSFAATGQLSLTDTVPTLTVNGAVAGSGVTLNNPGGITFASGSRLSSRVGGTVELDASDGAIDASFGVITAGVLTDTVATGGAGTFTDVANAVGTLGPFGATGLLSLTDNVPTLTIAGAVFGSGVTLNNTGGMTFAALSTLSAGVAGTVELDASGGPINAAQGAITAGVLTDTVTTGGAATFTDAANAVGTLGPFAAGGELSLTDTMPTLNVVGAVSASGVTLNNPGGITLAGGSTLSAEVGGTVELDASGGPINAVLGAITAGVLTDTVTTGGAATFTDAANAVGTLGPFAASGQLSLTDAVTTLNVAGAVSGAGVTLTNPGGITFALSSTLSAGAGGTVALNVSGGAINASGGAITAGVLNDSVMTGGAATFTDTSNAVTTLGPFAATGQLSLTDNVPTLNVTGAVSGSGVTLRNTGGITFVAASTLSAGASGTVELDATGGSINAAQGAITAAVLTDTVMTGGAATFTDAANVVTTLGPFAAAGELSLTDTVPTLNVAGAVSGSGVTLNNPDGIMFVGGGSRLSVGAVGTVELDASRGAINAELGVITAGVLTDTVATGGAATFTQVGNAVTTLGPFAATGQLSLTDNVPTLNVTGAVSGSGVTLRNTGGITFVAASTLSAGTSGTVELDATGGSINAAQGAITAAVLTDTDTTGGAARFTDAANAVTTLGPFAARGELSLIDTVPTLNVAGAVSASGVMLNNPGGITFATGSTLSAGAGGTVELDAASGAINAALGAITAGVLMDTVPTGGAATLTDAANAVGTLGPFAATGLLSLTDNVPTLTIAGAVSGAGVALNNTGGMTFAALSTLSAGVTGTLTLNALGGSIDASRGAITAGVLTDSVTTDGAATFTDLANAVATLGPFASTGTLSLTDHTALTLTGILSAPLIIINTQTNPLTMAAGTTLVTSGTAAPNQLTLTPGQVPTNPPPSNGVGAYFSSGAFTQLGTGTVTPITGSANTILSLSVVDGANVTFAGLTAPTTWLILGLDAADSKVTGTVAVKSLTLVLPANSVPSDFSVTLQGTVGGVSGQEAAGEGGIIPTKGATIQFNNCPIGTVGCVLLSGVPVPAGSPLQFLTLGILVAPSDEGDLLLPLVSDEDFLTCLLRKDCN